MTNSSSLDLVAAFQRHHENLVKTLAWLRANGYPYGKDTLRKELIARGALNVAERRKDGVAKPPQLSTSFEVSLQSASDAPPSDDKEVVSFTPEGNTAEAFYRGRKQITTLEELLEVAKVDTSIWTVENFIVNQWEMGYKDANKQAQSWPLYQVKATLRRIKLLPVNFEPIAPVQVEIFHRVQPRIVPSKIRRCAVIPDIQVGYRRNLMYGHLVPFHDRKVIDVGLQMLADMKPDVVVFLGDNADLPDWSQKYLTSPECQQITQTTLVELAWIYGKVRAICPHAEIHVIEGNHDARLQTAVIANLRPAYGLRAVDQLDNEPALSMERLLNLQSLDIEYHGSYPNGKYRLNSNFLFHHGRLVRSQSGKTVAAAANDLRRNEGFGHIHRVELASKTMWTAEDEPKVYQAWSFGTWASIMPGVVPGNAMEPNWQNAMGDIWYEVNSEGGDGIHDLATVTAPIIYRDCTIHNGKRYQSRDEEEIVADITAETDWDVTTGYFHRSHRKAA